MSSNLNPDFTFVEDRRPVKDGFQLLTRVLYKGEGIANIIHGFEPSEKGVIKGLKPEKYTDVPTGEEYVHTYGYMAEWRRRWNNGDRCNWSDDLNVQVEV